MTQALGAARKAGQRWAASSAPRPNSATGVSPHPLEPRAGQGGPCHYKDKSPRTQPTNGRGAPKGPGRGDKRATPLQAHRNLLNAVATALQAEGKAHGQETQEPTGRGDAGRSRAVHLGERVGAARRAVAAAAAAGVLPKHVRNCNGGAGARGWWLYTWRRDDPTKKLRTPYNCASWRCPHCARYEASVTFSRIRSAFEPLSDDGSVFFVLTLDREGYYSRDGGRWRNVTEAYRELGKLSEKFFKRLRRMHKRMGWAPFGSKWVATVEAHRSGWPHMNIVIHSPELAEYLENDRLARERRGLSSRDQVLVQDELRACVVGAGWGVQSTAERGRSKEALAGYITKLAGLAGSTAGEVAKITQAPTVAPERFRRLRAGKNFLPPRMSDPEVTGTLVRRYHLHHGPTVLPIHNVKGEDARAEVAACCEQEERLLVDELRDLARCRELLKCGALREEDLQPRLVAVYRFAKIEPVEVAPKPRARGHAPSTRSGRTSPRWQGGRSEPDPSSGPAG